MCIRDRTMTSKERLLRAFAGGEPDRVPVSPFGLGRIAPDLSLIHISEPTRPY